MAVFRGTIRSKVLQMDTNVNVIIPNEQHYVQSKGKPGTLILLHGLKQNADAWTRWSRVETFAHASGFNVIIPEVQRSFYADMVHGLPYFTYIAEELPQMMGEMFNIPTDREHLFAGGLSMGGFGAIKCALTYPDRFAGAMSFSGGLRCLEMTKDMAILPDMEYQAVLGMDLLCPDSDNLMVLAQKAASASKKPKLYVSCGLQDGLLEQSRTFTECARENGFEVLHEEWNGVHDWAFWDRALARGMAAMSGFKVADINSTDSEELGI